MIFYIWYTNKRKTKIRKLSVGIWIAWDCVASECLSVICLRFRWGVSDCSVTVIKKVSKHRLNSESLLMNSGEVNWSWTYLKNFHNWTKILEKWPKTNHCLFHNVCHIYNVLFWIECYWTCLLRPLSWLKFVRPSSTKFKTFQTPSFLRSSRTWVEVHVDQIDQLKIRMLAILALEWILWRKGWIFWKSWSLNDLNRTIKWPKMTNDWLPFAKFSL